MALLPILSAPHPVLSAKAKPVGAVTDALRTLLDDMAETMYAAPGVGLAAPQIGQGIRVVVIDPAAGGGEDDEGNEIPPRLRKLVNPEIVEGWGDTISIEEGCLSVPELYLEVPRHQFIRVSYLDEDGESQEIEFAGWDAIVVQHELDHLEGVTLYDRASKLKRRLYLRQKKKAEKALAKS